MKRLFFLITLLLFSVITSAKTYKWVDENGKTVYSQTPPPDGNAEIVNIKTTQPNSDAANKKLQEQLQRLKDLTEQRQLGKEKFAEEKKKRDTAKKNCQQVRNNIAKLKNSTPNVSYKMPDGSYKKFTPEEHKKLMDKNNKYLREHCK